MEKRIDAWVDKKMVISIALGILLAAWIMWFGAFALRAVGIGHGMGYGMKGGMRSGDMQGMHDRMMQRDMQYMNNNGAAGTFMEGSDIPTDLDTSAM